VKRGESLSFLVGTISNVLVMEIGWTDVGSGGYISVSCAHSNTSLYHDVLFILQLSPKGIPEFSFVLHVPVIGVCGQSPPSPQDHTFYDSNVSCTL
jgi:hypothetical protein